MEMGTTAADATEDPSTSSSSSSSSSTTAEPTTEPYAPIFDVAEIPDAADDDSGCTKVDFLFVIDNSGSMGDDQMNLVAAFPAFIEGIQATLGAVDSYHVGVITTDGYEWNDTCSVLGGLVTQTGGFDSSNEVCTPYASGLNFMTEEDDLEEKFACAAQVGTQGNATERPMESMVLALGQVWSNPGGCNEGFLRDDALLVVTVITDEADGPAWGPCQADPEPTSIGNPDTWYADVVEAKLGIPENVAVLALHYIPGECDPIFPDPISDGCNILEFTAMFGENGFVGCIDGEYGELFTAATDTIQQACAGLHPAGLDSQA